MERLTKRHGKHAVQIGGETRRHDVGWLRLAELEDMIERGELVNLDFNNFKRDSLDRCTHRNCNNCDKYRWELQEYKDLKRK